MADSWASTFFLGIYISDSDSNTITGDQILNNIIGIELSNSDDTLIQDANIEGNEIGLWGHNGSTGTLVGNTNFENGGIGVLLSGGGEGGGPQIFFSGGEGSEGGNSDMQFVGNTSTFSNLDYYFILEDGAMDGEVLDASQQFFEGVRAANFSPAQLADAEENHTIDEQDNDTVGDVFYTGFEDGTFDVNLLNQFLLFGDDRNFPGSRFSYAGHTIASTINELPFNFTLPNVNLNLLAPSAGGNPPVGGTPQNFGNLSPSAGGNLGDLSPAAGGTEAENCVNTFLTNSAAFNSSTCALEQ
jgi:parallel beta-helix repeat protein